MGYGVYDYEAHVRATTARAATPDASFRQGMCHPSMMPLGVLRESRDSAAHPASVGIVFALDVSGSMGEVPRRLATETLPAFMHSVTTTLPDAQVLFMAVGNAHTDRSALQIGQFESEDKLVDLWLERMHLEGGGGGLGESYDLAMLFAARCTRMDGLEKRGRKGYLFMTGDEPPFALLEPRTAAGWLGLPIPAPIAIHDLISEVTRSFHPFFIIPDFARAKQYETETIWRLLLRERAIVLATPDDVAVACALLVGITEGTLPDRPALERCLEDQLGRSGEARDRVVAAVLPYQEALARGPIGPPAVLGSRKVDGFKG